MLAAPEQEVTFAKLAPTIDKFKTANSDLLDDSKAFIDQKIVSCNEQKTFSDWRETQKIWSKSMDAPEATSQDLQLFALFHLASTRSTLPLLVINKRFQRKYSKLAFSERRKLRQQFLQVEQLKRKHAATMSAENTSMSRNKTSKRNAPRCTQ